MGWRTTWTRDLSRNVDRRLTRVKEELAANGGRLDGIDGRLDGIDGRLDSLEEHGRGVDTRLDGIESALR